MRIYASKKPQKNLLFQNKPYNSNMDVNTKSQNINVEEEQVSSFNMEAAKRNFKYFLQNTTLHGLKYISEEKITIFERVLFGLAFLFVVFLSGFFISNIYNKWSATPVIITTNARQILTSDVPFPAITICNLNLALKSKVEGIKKYSLNFSMLLSLCDEYGDSVENIGTWKYFKAILLEVAQPCSEMLLYCSYGARVENCSIMFHSMLTDDGLCCTFNALDTRFMLRNPSEENNFAADIDNHYKPIDWTPERGYDDDNLPEYYYPRVSGGAGSHMGLTVVLNASSSEYYCSKSQSVGFKVLVHNPAELPKISNYGFLVTAGREARIPIDPIYQDAVPSIRSIKRELRRCLFSDEGDLSYYRTYSLKNCEIECEAKILMEKCNCVLYYLPRIDPAMRICGPRDNLCTKQVQEQIESSNKTLTCSDCLPGCFELSYKATLTSASISFDSFVNVNKFANINNDIFDSKENIRNISIMHFYYLSNTMRSTRKSEMFGLTEFLSNTGGLLSLFMGFSIFSLIEIIFYITVRPYCASRAMKRKRHKKAQKTQSAWSEPIKRAYLPVHKGILGKHENALKNRFRKSINNILLQRDNVEKQQAQVLPYVD